MISLIVAWNWINIHWIQRMISLLEITFSRLWNRETVPEFVEESSFIDLRHHSIVRFNEYSIIVRNLRLSHMNVNSVEFGLSTRHLPNLRLSSRCVVTNSTRKSRTQLSVESFPIHIDHHMGVSNKCSLVWFEGNNLVSILQYTNPDSWNLFTKISLLFDCTKLWSI
jgi:hypothetical protein